ncbi:transcription activator MBF2 domain-containing protein [Phthorimaea operculella]|nr:transcription activator MBF2 domain-containing protein [Phthorimaea operculella]
MFRLVLAIVLLASVSCKDLEQGQNATEARKIFDEKREASPAVWRQVDKITINTPDAEVISRVVITDLRPNKDGEANIVEGGEGNQTVTIELKSPTVLRGYEFHIEVYAVPDKGHDVPALTGNDEPKVSTPAVDNDKSKGHFKPSEGELRLNIGEFEPPSNFGAESSTKPPVPLSTDLKVNDEKRITRDTEEKKLDTANHHDLVTSDEKITSDSEEKKLGATENHPITFVDPKDSLKIIPGRTDKPQKDIEVSTHLPTTAGDTKKDEHARHVRDTAMQTSTTKAPTTTKAVKDYKDDFPERIYPQSHLNKMGNTDKMVLPVEPETHDNKEAKTNKDGQSTTTTTSTLKPRAVRDTAVTTPKTEAKDKPQDDTYIQKIPADGLVTIPKEWTDFQNKNTTKTGLDKSEDNKTPPPVPLFPSFNQESDKNGPSFNQGAANNVPNVYQHSAKSEPGFNQDSAKNGPGFNHDLTKTGPGFNQDSAKNGPSVSTTAKPKVGPSSSDESDSSEEVKKPISFI